MRTVSERDRNRRSKTGTMQKGQKGGHREAQSETMRNRQT